AWELTVRALWRDRRELSWIAASCAIVAAATLPFLLPYVELRQLGFSPRSLDETRRFSADVYAYLTADPNLRLWGPIAQAWPHAEGVLFPGATILVLAIAGAVHARAARGCVHDRSGAMAGVLSLAWLAVGITLLLGHSIRLGAVKITNLPRALGAGTIGAAAAFSASPRARAMAFEWLRTPAGFFTLTAL